MAAPTGLSEGQRQLARRCATIAIACERMEGQAAAGQAIDLEAYGTLTDRLGRAFARLGLKRVARDIGPTSRRSLARRRDEAARWLRYSTRRALARWRREPISFIEQVLRNPETGRPFELLDAQRQFFAHAWRTTDDGRLLYPEQCYGAIKKSGKTATAAMHLLATTLLYGGRFAEGYAIANDLEQAQGRVFQAVRADRRGLAIPAAARPTSPSIASIFPRPAPPSRRSAPTTPAPRVPTRCARRSTSCGPTPASAAAASMTRWCPARRARSLVD